MYASLPKSDVARVLGHQALRSGTSVGAHYREGHRARSTAEFVSKIETAIQELDETKYWFELMVGAELVKAARLAALQAEANETIAFEDTPHGVTSAKAAGLTCVAVPNAITESLDFGQADVVLPSFTAKPLAALLSR